MTLKAFAENIVETVESAATHEEATGMVEGILEETVEPRDKKNFSKWGYPEMQTTPEKCWV